MSKRAVLAALLVVAVIAGVLIYRAITPGGRRSNRLWEFFADPDSHADWKIAAGTRCGDAPFIFPTDGMVGFLWDDSFRVGHHHQGIDIFAGTEVGVTAVVAAYDGYLTRLSDWKSTVIVRVPSDPLQPGRQIWLYYTHMANQDGSSYISADFPPGTSEVFVSAGTLLGYQGNYSGDPNNPTGIHLHFSIVRDDGNGNFLNELQIKNTYDPSPYLGLELNAHNSNGEPPLCALPIPE
jgi:murein DD-endopeptidase MepM/ murein hydrolase activator NlpD